MASKGKSPKQLYKYFQSAPDLARQVRKTKHNQKKRDRGIKLAEQLEKFFRCLAELDPGEEPSYEPAPSKKKKKKGKKTK